MTSKPRRRRRRAPRARPPARFSAGRQDRHPVADDAEPVARREDRTGPQCSRRGPQLLLRDSPAGARSRRPASVTNPTTSTTTAVALSSTAGLDRGPRPARRRRRGGRRSARGSPRSRSSSIIPVMPSLHSSSRSTEPRGSRKKSAADALGAAERAGDDVPLGVDRGLLGGDLAGVDELLDHAVVDADLLAAGARRCGRSGSRRGWPAATPGRRRPRRAAPTTAVVPACQPRLHGPGRRAYSAIRRWLGRRGVARRLGPAARVVALLGQPRELLDHDPAGDVAVLVAAHAVGDDEDGRRDEVGVLVDLAHQPDVGGRPVVELDLAHRLPPRVESGAVGATRRVASAGWPVTTATPARSPTSCAAGRTTGCPGCSPSVPIWPHPPLMTPASWPRGRPPGPRSCARSTSCTASSSPCLMPSSSQVKPPRPLIEIVHADRTRRAGRARAAGRPGPGLGVPRRAAAADRRGRGR